MNLKPFAVAALAVVLSQVDARGQSISKGNQLLINNGIQIQGLVNKDDPFHLDTYKAANYTSVIYEWDSNVSQLGAAPGFAWSRWVRNQGETPPLGAESQYLDSLVTLQLGDEPNLNDDATRTTIVNWYNAVRANFPNTILYTNNYGGQVSDGPLGDFVSRAKPDMITFDTYPYQPGAMPLGGSPTNWYGDLRRYRVHAAAGNIPFGSYRETYHASDGRDPSESEFKLNTFGALAFNAKTLIDFTYNKGSTSFFAGPGDTNPNQRYTWLQNVNKEVRNLGPALTRLKPLNPNTDGGSATTDVMFIKGKHTNSSTFNSIPIGFAQDAESADATVWTPDVNDPYLRGWVVKNQQLDGTPGTKNNGLNGDVIIAWFRPLDESFDGPNFNNEIYMMVVNGLSDMNGSSAECHQQIKLNFLNSFSQITVLDPVTGQLVDQTLPIVSTRRQLTLELDGGDVALFKFKDGAPFVGVPEPAMLSLLSLAPLLLRRASRKDGQKQIGHPSLLTSSVRDKREPCGKMHGHQCILHANAMDGDGRF